MKKYIKKTWRLQTKITILVMGVVFISISIIMSFIIPWTSKNVQNKVEVNVMNVARLTAKSANIKEDLSKNDPDKEIQSYVNVLLSSVENIEFIVVADMDGIRYAHPNPERVGERFVGGDFDRVVNNGETYISQAQGTLGKSLRAFTPIYDPDNQKQLGFVSVG
ncbi:MAG: sensor histidine kinase, partial [Clostridia bacterium]|nr:sensor histidine kinase [Clostridia bacterium]